MKQWIYCMRFKGQAKPDGDSGEMIVETAAPSCSITTALEDGPGVKVTWQPIVGGSAQFQSRVQRQPDGSFLESGTVWFSGPDKLYFSTFSPGRMGPSADQRYQSGSIAWKVESGEGQFQGASGIITSNFTLDAQGDVSDYQFGLLFLPEKEEL
ncbi:MAG: hypothetical protein SFV54_22300 [Bryobacteraceae bacterium]|nr:hypothetical protein [Bryobacteraceae bacterium]